MIGEGVGQSPNGGDLNAVDELGHLARLLERCLYAPVLGIDGTAFEYKSGGCAGQFVGNGGDGIDADDLPDDWAELVVKPGDGAGSQGIQRLPREAFLRWKQSLSSDDVTTGGWIVQPLISGRTLSVAAIFATDGSLHDIWPVAEQFLDSKTFAYLGGLIPAGRVNRSHIEALIMDVVACVSGLRGYIGFDLIERPNGEVVVVEINPRLTTSYIGYRTLAASSLASWLEPKAQALSPPEWTSGTVRFTAAGEVSFTQGTEDTPA